MARRIAGAIVRFRVPILILFALLAVYSFLSIGKVRVNYDFTRYLSDATLTKRSLNMMRAEFGDNEQLSVMFVDFEDGAFDRAFDDIRWRDGVLYASHDPATDDRTVDGVRHRLVGVTLENDADAFQMARALRTAFHSPGGEVVVAGGAADMIDMQEVISVEADAVLTIAIGVLLLVLLATTHAWAGPIPILVTLALSILVNMGTNWVFGTISFVAYAVCAILQLALSMDYGVMLLHMYDALRDEGMEEKAAMVEALARMFMPIASSALTTVAGFFALLFMSFTLGFDIGIVLSKGILISMFSVFLAMPALVLLLSGLLRKTAHRPLNIGGGGIAKLATRGGAPVIAVLLLVIGASGFLQNRNSYIFSGTVGMKSANRVAAVFGSSNAIAILVPGGSTDADYEKQAALVEAISAIESDGSRVVTSATAMVTTGAQAVRYYTPADVAEEFDISRLLVNLIFNQQGFGESVRGDALIEAAYRLAPQNEVIADLQDQLDAARTALEGPNYARILFSMDMPEVPEATYRVIDRMAEAIEAAYGDDYGIAGTSVSSYDVSGAFGGDMLKVSLITAGSLLLIIALSFLSLSVPVILVCVIQGAIWVTMAVSYAISEPIFFMSYLMCMAMQMGATIDYGILLTSHYRACRRELPPAPALARAVKLSLPTVLTSGLILATAGLLVGWVSTVYYVYSIGFLLARGAAVSIVMILVLLPALLVRLDRLVTGRASCPPDGSSRSSEAA